MNGVIVVGSGASAVHAAWPLVEAGVDVLMLDVGNRDDRYAAHIPDKAFTEIRRTDPEQHRYFLGDEFEGIPLGPVRVGAQLTPPRQHIPRDAERLLPLKPGDYHAMQSLAVGGLGAGWGAAVPPFNDAEMASWPIGRAELQPHYEAVAARIGICGPGRDDITMFLQPELPSLPPARIDSNASAIYRRYRENRGWFHDKGLFMGAARLAMVTKPFRGRGPLRYHDMEFWGDNDRAVYRPAFTLEELRAKPHFEYRAGLLVEGFTEDADGVTVTALEVASGTRQSFRARKLVLAAGALGSARIALPSLDAWDRAVPLVSNPYTYFPCLVHSRLGQPTRDRRHSLTQLMMLYDPIADPAHAVQAQIYSYRSLLTFKLMKESPLAMPQARRVMQLLQSYFIIVGVHHEDRPHAGKRILLRREGEGARLEIRYRRSREEEIIRDHRERGLMSLFRRLGCWPLKRLDPGDGSSIHYAGTLPMAAGEEPLTSTPEGLLRPTTHVHIADGAAFPHLPAKGLTLTLMANANRVGTLLAKRLIG